VRVALCLSLVLSSCVLVDANRNNQQLATVATVRGTLKLDNANGRAAFVVLLEDTPQGWRTYSNRLLYESGPFEFLVRGGKWRVFTFVDDNGDLAWDPADRSDEGKRFDVTDGAVVDVPPLMPRAGGPKPPSGINVATPTVAEELVKVHRGDPASLEEERFSTEAGEFGYWQPAEFALKHGVGVSFLQPYDASKIPVLFVHGAQGAPANFTALVAALDRSKFQPWVFSYPSGIRLGLAASTLTRIVDGLQRQLGFERLIVVAHSMGGLVARAFVVEVSARPERRYVKLFVSISSPFGGHAAARSGVKHSPVVVPSWLDMAPGSPFLIAQQVARLPPEVPHHLLFGYIGGSSDSAGPTDGTLTLRSMLHTSAQDAAALVRGFPFDHVGILSSPEVIGQLNASLRTVAP
jgi:pimeloyl-ACP methyl ester carboxylesterase